MARTRILQDQDLDFKDQDKDKDLSGKDQDQDLTVKDKDKDFTWVLKESLRTRIRTSTYITETHCCTEL